MTDICLDNKVKFNIAYNILRDKYCLSGNIRCDTGWWASKELSFTDIFNRKKIYNACKEIENELKVNVSTAIAVNQTASIQQGIDIPGTQSLENFLMVNRQAIK